MAEINKLPALPLGTSDFETLRLQKKIYVDKTALVCQLASRAEKFFLTRPRRFGKSLLISTFASLFRDGLKHFSGLAIEKLWKDTTYTVIELDFSKVKNFEDLADFDASLRSFLVRAFAKYGFVYDRSLESEWMDQISDWLEEQPNGSLVLLIDEYDAPLTACLDNKALFRSIRKRLSKFYSIVKSNDACWRFVFMTGIAKFNQTGIFSELNNFTDISLKPSYGSLLGYTDEDIDRYFSGYILQAARVLNLPAETVRRLLRENYDGYCFDKEASYRVYAPWSVLSFLSSPEDGFENYWMQSGGNLSLLQQYLHSHSLKAPEAYDEEQEVRYDDLNASTDFDGISDVALLTQAGYLTIKQRIGQFFLVGYPNQEVATSLATLYTNMLLHNRSFNSFGAGRLSEAVCDGDVDLLFEQANHAFAGIDYQQHPISNEKHCQSFLQIFLAGLGFSVIAERHGALGRSDLEIDAPKIHWVLEFKYQRKGESVEALLAKAVAQFAQKQYGASLAKPAIRVAAVFSEEKRTFVRWQPVASSFGYSF